MREGGEEEREKEKNERRKQERGRVMVIRRWRREKEGGRERSHCVLFVYCCVRIQFGPEAIPEGGSELAGLAALSEPQRHTSR